MYPFVRRTEFSLPVDDFDALIVPRRENPDSPPSSAHTDHTREEQTADIPTLEKKRRGRPPKKLFDTTRDPNSSGDPLSTFYPVYSGSVY